VAPSSSRKIGRADQQDVDARDRAKASSSPTTGSSRSSARTSFVVHGIEVIAVIFELAPLAAHPGVAAVAEGKIAAGAHGGLRLHAGVDHRTTMPRAPASSAKQIDSLVRGDAHQRRRLLAAHRLDRRLHCLISQAECWVSNSRKSYPASARIDTSTFGVTVVPTTVSTDLNGVFDGVIWRRCLPQYSAGSTDRGDGAWRALSPLAGIAARMAVILKII